MFPGLAAAVHAAAAALPAATPVIATAVIGLGVVATHEPEPETVVLQGPPELAAECVRKSAAAHSTRLAAVTQPLYGTATYSVVLKRGGVTGDPVMTLLLQENAAGSTVEFRPIAGVDPGEAAITQLIAGCRIAPSG